MLAQTLMAVLGRVGAAPAQRLDAQLTLSWSQIPSSWLLGDILEDLIRWHIKSMLLVVNFGSVSSIKWPLVHRTWLKSVLAHL